MTIPMHPDRLVFVYNESTGLFNAVSGWTHKLVSPTTYACSLCRVTFGLSGMLVPWKSFIEGLPFRSDFLHRDEFWMQFPTLAQVTLPVVLVEKDGQRAVLLTANEIDQCGGVAALIVRLQLKLEQWRTRAHFEPGPTSRSAPPVLRPIS